MNKAKSKLQIRREVCNISLEEMSQDLKISVKQLVKYENAKDDMSTNAVYHIPDSNNHCHNK